LCLALLLLALTTTAAPSKYSADVSFDLHRIPFASTMLLLEGTDEDGDRAFADDLRVRFLDAVVKSGFPENFDAQTGKARIDCVQVELSTETNWHANARACSRI
jgi:hypothetical protein